MEKRHVIEQIQAYLANELAAIAESELDEDRARAGEIHRLLLMYRFMPVREFGAEDVICPSSLVELEFNGRHSFYLIVTQGGGLVTEVDGKPIQVITPQSPLGEALMGRKTGDGIEVRAGSGIRHYRVVSLR